jgi:hypothetical protein
MDEFDLGADGEAYVALAAGAESAGGDAEHVGVVEQFLGEAGAGAGVAAGVVDQAVTWLRSSQLTAG